MSRTICATCCATKRLVEIRCPADCVHLQAAQRHPAAAVRRQQEQDLGTLMSTMDHRLSEVQLHIFFLLASVVVRYRPEGPLRLLDADVADAAGAMATTLEAASGGLIAQVAGTSPTGEGLRRQFDAMLSELGQGGGARYARDAAEVLRGIERGARHDSAAIGSSDTAYVALLGRVLPVSAEPVPEPPASPIILP